MARNKTYYLERAKVGIKTLVIYFNVTRPQYEKAYKKDGKFSIDELLKQLKFLEEWEFRTRKEKQILFPKYKAYSKTKNYTFGIPRKLVDETIGRYKRKRIPRSEVIGELEKEGWLEKDSHGSKVIKENGEWKKLYSFTTKYKIKNRDYWLKLLSDENYSDYTKYPRDIQGFVERAVKIISKWRKSFPKKEIEEPKQEMTLEARQWFALNKITKDEINGVIHEFETERCSFGSLQHTLDEYKIPKELYAWLEKRAYQRKHEYQHNLKLKNKTEGNGNGTTYKNTTTTPDQNKQGQEISDASTLAIEKEYYDID